MGQVLIKNVVQPIGGLINNAILLPNIPGEPAYPIYSGLLGDPSLVIPSITPSILDGAGGALTEEEAQIKAVAETVERYSSCIYNEEEQFIWATAEELGNDALDLDLIPRVSERELQNSKCKLELPKKNLPIRWVKGISLFDKKEVWVPANMVYLHIPYKSIGEKFWLPISTGCAAHVTMEEALLGAINEVIERDAISTLWLQQLELPRIVIDKVPDWAIPFIEQMEKNEHVQHYFFDATTDLGIPTIYCVQISPHNKDLATLVMCSTELDPYKSLTKIMREAASSRMAMQHRPLADKDVDDFIEVHDGAHYMGKPENMHAFNFLLHSKNRRNISDIPVLETGSPTENLKKVVNLLKEKGHEVIAVDLTTDEARRAGLKVVRVVIPTLMPLSFSYTDRFLGTKRLYEVPRLLGYPVKEEHEINPWPQPFA
ncbi:MULTISPECIES: YcaO-like family protein [Lysinibacillus]|uniref:YcaO-like family protein n=1 Tax=Lysinibacillus TaxID=400634 RepID=UPI00237E9457|nr:MULTISPECIES: YcaO-like family protein [Lysinibacillus]WDU79263.1 YcaO-like family protein [Lysinibacillus sp. G01H]